MIRAIGLAAAVTVIILFFICAIRNPKAVFDSIDFRRKPDGSRNRYSALSVLTIAGLICVWLIMLAGFSRANILILKEFFEIDDQFKVAYWTGLVSACVFAYALFRIFEAAATYYSNLESLEIYSSILNALIEKDIYSQNNPNLQLLKEIKIPYYMVLARNAVTSIVGLLESHKPSQVNLGNSEEHNKLKADSSTLPDDNDENPSEKYRAWSKLRASLFAKIKTIGRNSNLLDLNYSSEVFIIEEQYLRARISKLKLDLKNCLKDGQADAPDQTHSIDLAKIDSIKNGLTFGSKISLIVNPSAHGTTARLELENQTNKESEWNLRADITPDGFISAFLLIFATETLISSWHGQYGKPDRFAWNEFDFFNIAANDEQLEISEIKLQTILNIPPGIQIRKADSNYEISCAAHVANIGIVKLLLSMSNDGKIASKRQLTLIEPNVRILY